MRTMQALFTRDDYMALPVGFPAQLIEGCLVKSPGPTVGHQVVQSRLHVAVAAVAGADRALPAPLDVFIDEHNVYQPDLVVARGALSIGGDDIGIPLIAMEVLSPSTERHDRRVKTARLLAAGVAEVWLLDLGRRRIEVHTVTGKRVAHGAEPLCSRALPGLELVADRLFA